MQVLVSLILNSLAVFASAYILPGIHVADFMTAVVVAIVLSFLNAFVRPVLLLLTLPINIITLGLFTFVITGLLVLLVSVIVPGFKVDNFLWAIAFAIVLSVFNTFLNSATYS